jgi:hypothetical protein
VKKQERENTKAAEQKIAWRMLTRSLGDEAGGGGLAFSPFLPPWHTLKPPLLCVCVRRGHLFFFCLFVFCQAWSYQVVLLVVEVVARKSGWATGEKEGGGTFLCCCCCCAVLLSAFVFSFGCCGRVVVPITEAETETLICVHLENSIDIAK